MRIAAVHVDGYGHLCDRRIDDLPNGLTVFVGANEAGKSTLLDFVRGVLFGFPDRRHKAPFHEPLRGGRHGGSVELVDDDGAHYLLDRHVDDRVPALSIVGGAVRDPSALVALLGGADDTLFRSIFAFGLGELSSFQTLDSDEIRDLVFSAGVLGAGRSATKATKALEQRRLALVRQRRGEALANGLRFELDEIESDLRAARRAAEDIHVLVRTREHAERALDEARAQSGRIDRRRRELDQIRTAWPTAHRRQVACAAFAALSGPTAAEASILDSAETIERVERQRSGRIERLRRRDELVDQRDGVLRELAIAKDALAVDDGYVFDPTSIPLSGPAAQLSERAQETNVRSRALDEQRVVAEQECVRAQAIRDRIADGQPIRSADAIQRAVRENAELRTHLRERERAELDAVNALNRPGGAAPRHRVVAPSLLAIMLLVIVAIAAVGIDGSGHHISASVVAVLGVIVLAAGVVAVRSGIGRSRDLTGPGVTRSEHDDRRDREIVRLSDALGLAGEVTEAALDSLAHILDDERETRRSIDDADQVVAEACRRRDGIDAARAALAGERLDLDAAAAALVGRCALEAPVRAATVAATVASLRRGAELSAAERRITGEIDRIEYTTRDDLAAMHALAEAAEVPQVADLDGEGVLDHLVGELSRLRRVASERLDLERTVREATAELDVALGDGADAERVHAELAGGDVLGWEDERAALDSEKAAADATYDAALESLRDAERAVDQVERSDEIAALELRRAGVTASLDRALREWVELGVAEALLAEALARYERERQPEVIARAAELFAEVTDGRYVAIVPREEIDSNRRRGIEVIGPSGARVDATDLSRGTAEQLYLCLRLAFAATFAERAVALPLVLDDVLVNFDPARAGAMARVIAKTAATHQVLAFTCHPHIVEHFAAAGDIHVVDLGRG